MPVFQGVSPWHTIFISPWVIPLWDSATAHLPSAQELNSYSQGDARFSGFAPWHSISLHPSSSLFETQQELTHTLVKDSSLPLWKNYVSQGLLLCNVLILSFFRKASAFNNFIQIFLHIIHISVFLQISTNFVHICTNRGRRHAFEKGECTESLKKCPPPWLGDEENFEIYKL